MAVILTVHLTERWGAARRRRGSAPTGAVAPALWAGRIWGRVSFAGTGEKRRRQLTA